jgi:hypothetical protein
MSIVVLHSRRMDAPVTDATGDRLGEFDAIFDRRGLSSAEMQKVWETILLIAEWRVQQSEPHDTATFARDMSDPRTRTRIALESPELLRLLEEHNSPGSFGAWLRDAITEEKSRTHAGNVIDIESRRERT